MIICLEGPDGSGKTTLAAELMKASQARPVQVLHSRYRKDQAVWDLGALRRAIKIHLAGGIAILDRHWIGDNVYGQTFRNQGGIWTRRMDSILRRYGCLYVLCIPPVNFVVDHFAKLKEQRKEMYQTMGEVACRYIDLYEGNILRHRDGMDYVELASAMFPWSNREDVIRYDISRQPKSQTKRFAAELLLRAYDLSLLSDPLRSTSLEGNWNFSGSAAVGGDLIVLQTTTVGCDYQQWPVASRLSEHEFFNEALHLAKVDESKIMLMTAFDQDYTYASIAKVTMENDRRGFIKRVVALGDLAYQTVDRLGYKPRGLISPRGAMLRDFTVQDYARQLQGALYG